ncbi:MAG: hypothetical protein FWB96_12540 [Defluviitaleaceae bacterium]|nr:hypothetical protein [Defluviitaleaceae bacterium]MCL2263953.1 hypothetical protein [Defluviitaleaceae bacterium]
MKQSETVFYKSTLRKILFLIDEYFKSGEDEPTAQGGTVQVQEVKTMGSISRMAQSLAGGD